MGWIFYIMIVAIITRLDGWGPETTKEGESWPKWHLVLAKTFGVWSCGGLVFLVTLLFSGNAITSLVVALGFVLWRAPELGDYWGPDWRYWPMMFVRGALTTLPIFTILSVILYNHVYWGWLFIPMGVAQMLLYNGMQRFSRDVKQIPWFHMASELGTGAVFSGLITIICVGV